MNLNGTNQWVLQVRFAYKLDSQSVIMHRSRHFFYQGHVTPGFVVNVKILENDLVLHLDIKDADARVLCSRVDLTKMESHVIVSIFDCNRLVMRRHVDKIHASTYIIINP